MEAVVTGALVAVSKPCMMVVITTKEAATVVVVVVAEIEVVVDTSGTSNEMSTMQATLLMMALKVSLWDFSMCR